MINHDIMPAVNTVGSAESLSTVAVRLRKKIKVHVKVDTGMGRLGIVCPDSGFRSAKDGEEKSIIHSILKVASLPGIEVEGIFTHFANADSADKKHVRSQFELFLEVLDRLKAHSLEVPLRHAANSAALIDMPETHLDMVRPGISLYGLWPSTEVHRSRVHLKPVMSIKSMVIQVKEVPSRFKVSYGSTYETEEPTKLATVPIGYADAYSRLLSSKGMMLVRGQRAPIVGRVCMDLVIIDVGCIPGVREGDEVVVLGKQGKAEVTADEIAGLAGTINYEVVSTITARVPRIYRRAPG
jgi:alanine racemase